MNITNVKFPYYRNVPNKNNNLSIKTEFYSHEDYIKYLNIDPIKHIYMLDYETE